MKRIHHFTERLVSHVMGWEISQLKLLLQHCVQAEACNFARCHVLLNVMTVMLAGVRGHTGGDISQSKWSLSLQSTGARSYGSENNNFHYSHNGCRSHNAMARTARRRAAERATSAAELRVVTETD